MVRRQCTQILQNGVLNSMQIVFCWGNLLWVACPFSEENFVPIIYLGKLVYGNLMAWPQIMQLCWLPIPQTTYNSICSSSCVQRSWDQASTPLLSEGSPMVQSHVGSLCCEISTWQNKHTYIQTHKFSM